jgi:hypothetical protein
LNFSLPLLLFIYELMIYTAGIYYKMLIHG